MKVYGIANCSTVKKTIDWLTSNGHILEFHDYKKRGITEEKLNEWSSQVGWECLVNKRGTTWRMLPREQQQRVTNNKSAIELMLLKPSVIKRPIIEYDGKLMIGFNADEYANTF